MATVTIQNKTKQPLILNLPHHIVPECACMMTVLGSDHNKHTGEKSFRATRKAVSGSVTLLAKGNVEGLPVSVQRAPDVIEALKAGKITLTVKE